MKKGTQSRGYFIGGIIFVVILTFIVVKGDLLLNYVMSQKDALPVRAVKIDGVFKQLTKKQIADVTGRVCAGQNIATLDLNVLKQTLLKEPWIAQVAIQKKMPDTLLLSVIEHVPAAYWNDEGLYDAKTKSIFYPDLSKFNQPLVKLGAFSDDFCQEVYESAVAMSNSRYQMVALYLDNVRSYTLTLDNGTLLILGRGQQKALTRLKRFLEAFGHSGLNIDDVEYVDLRYDVGFAVGKKSQS